ncbi:NUDIX hydrolase [Candidatus Enterococcus clewellii]|uniref:ADP-ribose pyrophosphatase n=1 Tax=Candidatus Enterococcus clewellii TaxID=1834193 RepID=A0A242K6B4_9ENTE|nr:NUDIX hydrolase [Enterococcus sp. 9E7_DIV0242]OTP15839.1 ADP-ribose pyrophosphatase [Enterococcus sp. 9E7_DIV0242]
MKYEDFEEKTLSRKEIFKGKIIDVVVDDVRLPDGAIAKRELVFHPGAVAIIPITEDNRLVMVKQFRKPLEKVTLEIPAGKIDPGEQDVPIETARRELEEETGYQAQTLEPVTSMYVSPGFANELLHVFYGEKLTKVENPLPQDEDEVLELYELTLEEAKQEIKNGLICDAKTVFAVQYWELMQLKRKQEEVQR